MKSKKQTNAELIEKIATLNISETCSELEHIASEHFGKPMKCIGMLVGTVTETQPKDERSFAE